jgi:hypothetical protein
MIDTTCETLISLPEAGRLLPPGRRGKRPTLSCILRWIMLGVRKPHGEIVRLEALRVGGRWVTSREALQRFAQALTPRFGDAAPVQRSPAARRRAAARAARALEQAGI